jgi:hypothetical protein
MQTRYNYHVYMELSESIIHLKRGYFITKQYRKELFFSQYAHIQLLN